jgi:hypothetical protein
VAQDRIDRCVVCAQSGLAIPSWHRERPSIKTAPSQKPATLPAMVGTAASGTADRRKFAFGVKEGGAANSTLLGEPN